MAIPNFAIITLIAAELDLIAESLAAWMLGELLAWQTQLNQSHQRLGSKQPHWGIQWRYTSLYAIVVAASRLGIWCDFIPFPATVSTALSTLPYFLFASVLQGRYKKTEVLAKVVEGASPVLESGEEAEKQTKSHQWMTSLMSWSYDSS